MATICPDLKWLGRISDPIQNPDHLQPNFFSTIWNPDKSGFQITTVVQNSISIQNQNEKLGVQMMAAIFFHDVLVPFLNARAKTIQIRLSEKFGNQKYSQFECSV